MHKFNVDRYCDRLPVPANIYFEFGMLATSTRATASYFIWTLKERKKEKSLFMTVQKTQLYQRRIEELKAG